MFPCWRSQWPMRDFSRLSMTSTSWSSSFRRARASLLCLSTHTFSVSPSTHSILSTGFHSWRMRIPSGRYSKPTICLGRLQRRYLLI